MNRYKLQDTKPFIIKLAIFLYLATCILQLSACGFHPVYGVNKYTSVGAEEKLEHIQIGNIPDREGQYLRNALMDRFYRHGRPADTRYALNIKEIREGRIGLDITKDADATRGQLSLSTSMQLVDRQNDEVLLERKLQAISSYNILTSEFTNRVSEQNARENALDELARQAEQYLALYFKRAQ